jgi:hypothetical protein
MSLRCLPSSVPSGPKYSWVLYEVAPSRSLTPIETYAPAARAASPKASVAGLGISTAWSNRRANQPASPSSQGRQRHTQSG